MECVCICEDRSTTMLLQRLKHLLRSILLSDVKPVIIQLQDIKPCVFCQKPLSTLDGFCRYCGCAQYVAVDPQTTGHHFNLPAKQQPTTPARLLETTSDLRAVHGTVGSRSSEVYRQILKDNGMYRDGRRR